MGGGLLQLVAYGAQDAYITGNPQITFWKGLFKRHTNFAMEPFRINFSGQVQWGTKQTALVGRHADLLYSTYVEVVLPLNGTDNLPYKWNNEQGALGYNLIKYAELDVGGQVIDRMYSEFMAIWGNLTSSATNLFKLKNLLSGPCESERASELTYGTGCAADGRPLKNNVLYIPLPFFFTRNPGAALPLIALQYHEVKINILWNDPELIAGNFRTGTKTIPSAIQAAIYIDYIYLDTEERRRMAQASHEYLIEQTQFNEDKGIVGVNNRIDLTFNHPVKELIWVVQPATYTDCRLASSVDVGSSILNNFSSITYSASSQTGPGGGATFSFTWIGGVYTAYPSSFGTGYTTGVGGSVLRFFGDVIDEDNGVRTVNDAIITVLTVGAGGVISSYAVTGTAPPSTLNRLKPFTYDIDPVFEQWIQINGQDRLDRRFGDYFSRVQPYQHHSGNLIGLFNQSGGLGGGVYCYSFALRPEEHQPSGTCNFSRIDTATIVMNMAGLGTSVGTGTEPNFGKNPDYNNWNVRVYAINYNVLRVMSGMGGLAYSN